MTRRRFVQAVAAGAAVSPFAASSHRLMAAPAAATATTSPSPLGIRAVAFDAFVIFDPRPLWARLEQLFPGKGAPLAETWRTRQFEYTWLRRLGGRYADFRQVTEDALAYAARLHKVDLPPERRREVMAGYAELKAWPDVPAGLAALKGAGLRLAFLSNMTPAMLDAAVRSAGLDGMFDASLSTDAIQTYKPDPRAYALALDALKLNRNEIAFVAFGGWDAAGAKWFGFPTFWCNRMMLPLEELNAMPDAIGANLNELLTFVTRGQRLPDRP